MKKRNKKHGITRISVSLPKEMLPKLDELARRQMRYSDCYGKEVSAKLGTG